MENKESSVLLTTFLKNCKRYKVVFHHGKIIWEKEKPPCEQCNLPMENVISVEQNRFKSTHPLEEPTLDPNHFTIHYTVPTKHSKWQYKSITFRHPDNLQVASWVKTLRNHLKSLKDRPKRLLVFVNPFGGKCDAMKIYERYAKPLFDIAGIDVTLNVSQRKRQIWDYVEMHSLEPYDAIAVVGGDGTVSELFNGLVMRECRLKGSNFNDLEEPLPKSSIPVGIIPGGSTNTIAYCLHGNTDIVTSVLHIIFGDRLGLDLVGVYDESKLLRLYASVLSYGYLGDVAYQSDAYRWMGPKRYDYTGFKKIVQNKGYEGELAILSNDTAITASDGSGAMTESGYSGSTELTECYANCSVCEAYSTDNVAALADNSPEDSKDSKDSDYRWKIVNGNFFMVSGANISCACERTPKGMAPYSHLGDGHVHLVLVRKTSILNVLRLLVRLTGRKGIEDLPYVEVHRAKQFCFRSAAGQNRSVWNCDGEVQSQSDVRAKVWCQLLTVFSRHRLPEKEKSGCCGKRD